MDPYYYKEVHAMTNSNLVPLDERIEDFNAQRDMVENFEDPFIEALVQNHS